ncbi:Uncharacterised protein [uncultured archaeon]|nr:Uncharacterised protein [uncultured archaeon]
MKSLVSDAFFCICVLFACATVAATETFSRGAHFTHKPSCSFQHVSQTQSAQFGHLWKFPFASFCAFSKAASCSFCHSGDMPVNRPLTASTPLSTP